MPCPIAAAKRLCWRSVAIFVATTLPLAATSLDDVQNAATEWARLRAETTRLETDWTTERNLLGATVNNLTVEADQLERAQAAAQAENRTQRETLAQLTADNTARAEAIAAATVRLEALTDTLRTLRPALPPRLSAALDLPYRSLDADYLRPADRLRHTLTILNRCQEFDQAFVLAEETLPLASGEEPRLLEVLYLGLAQACALDRATNEAYLGRPINGSWQWVHVPGLAPDAARLIAVRRDETPPEFVTLPLQITGGDQ